MYICCSAWLMFTSIAYTYEIILRKFILMTPNCSLLTIFITITDEHKKFSSKFNITICERNSFLFLDKIIHSQIYLFFFFYYYPILIFIRQNNKNIYFLCNTVTYPKVSLDLVPVYKALYTLKKKKKKKSI